MESNNELGQPNGENTRPSWSELLNHHFEGLAELGNGGSAQVFKAKPRTGSNTQESKEVAIKVLTSTDTLDTSLRERFLDEFQTCHALNHPNIVRTYELIDEGDCLAFTMEYVEGKTLDKIVEANEIERSPEVIDKIMSQLLSAIEFLHSRNITHRDLKPENIIITSDGTLKLIDLGILKRTDRVGYTDPTLMLGTAQYLAPEYIHRGEYDYKSDIYACGIILLELVTGKFYLSGLQGMEVLEHLIRTNFRQPKIPLSGSYSKYSSILEKALAVDPRDRYQSAKEMCQSILRIESNNKKPSICAKLIKNLKNWCSVTPR